MKLHGVGQQLFGIQLVLERGEELVLQADPGDVAAVADTVRGAVEGQCLLAVEQMAAEVKTAVGIVDGFRQRDLDAADRVDE